MSHEVENHITEEKFMKESAAKQTVAADSEMKKWLVEYVGEKCRPEDDMVTVEMIVETMAAEFPEFVLALAEENFFRGYHQALHDVEEGKKLMEQEKDD